MVSIFDGFLNILRKVISGLCIVLLCGQVLLVSWAAFSRYVLKSTPAWGENSALLCMVWFCLLSATLAVKDDIHLRMTLIDNFVSPKVIRALDLLSLVLIGAFGVFMFVWGIGLTKLASRNILTGMGISSGILYASIPVAGLAFLVSAIDRGRDILCPRTR